MPMLMGLCDRVYAMDAGVVIAAGTPAEVRNDPGSSQVTSGPMPPPFLGQIRRSRHKMSRLDSCTTEKENHE